MPEFPREEVALLSYRACLLPLIMLAITGCSVGNWFMLTSSDRIDATPARIGVPYRDISLVADGIRLNGWYVTGAPSMPLILMFHGNNGNIGDAVAYIRLFHGAGFSVCLFDYRGYGVSSGEARAECDLYADGRRVVDYVRSSGWCPQRIIYYGQSMGAAVALQMALEEPPAGLVLESPFTSFADIATFHAPIGYPLVGRLLIDLAFDNVAKIGLLRTPLLIIHGDGDLVVPVAMSRRLFDRARTGKELCLIRGGRHCDGFSVGGEAIMPVIHRFAAQVAG